MRLTPRGSFLFWTAAVIAIFFVGPYLAYTVGAYVLGIQ